MKGLTVFVIAVVALTASAYAAEPLVWTVGTRAEVLRGDARGVSIGHDGTISTAPAVSEVFRTDESYVWSSAVDAAGNVLLGTGGNGRVFRVDASGRGALLADLPEQIVSAVVVGRGGEVYAATMPDGKVYRIDAAGKFEPYFDPKQKYIWSLAVVADALIVATGDGGRIYRVRTANAEPTASLLFDSAETNIITVTPDGSGGFYAGTDPGGIVLRFGADGKPFGLLDSPLKEIHEIAVAADGSVYALAIGESASAAKAADTAATAAAESKPVTVERPNPLNPEPSPKSRYDLSAAKSAVYRITPDGANSIIWSSAAVTGFSLAAMNDGVLIGTSDKGRIYRVGNDAAETLYLQTNAGQVSTLRSAANTLVITSSNQGTLYRAGTSTGAEGTYESAVLDARSTAAWGRIWWRSTGNVSIQTRSGNTERPDETWSTWSAAATDPRGQAVASPASRFFQWRATLRGGASLNEVNLAFAGRNIAPEILTLSILPTNVGLAGNPPIPVDPNIQIAGMDPVLFGIPNVAVPPRRLFQKGAVSLQWTAEDRNGDRLVYDVYYREVSETTFKLLSEGQTDTFYVVDGQSLADGRYVFRVVARDSLSNPATHALSGERVSEVIDIDNTPPVVTAVGSPSVSGGRAKFIFDAADAASYIVRAEYSVNGGEWMTVYPDDGISDSPRERYTVDIGMPTAGEYSVTLRVFDVNSNAGNARQVARL